MAHKVIHESKHIARRVLIGFATGILGTIVVYFVFNKKPRATEAEVRKNTIAAWKIYVKAENTTGESFDSSFARMHRQLGIDGDKMEARHLAINAFCKRDSLTALQFINKMHLLEKEKDIDQDLLIFLGTRIGYQQQQINSSLRYTRRMMAVLDTSLALSEINLLTADINKLNTERRNNITLRIGRNIEYFSDVLTRKHKYPFAFSDITYHSNYMSLKRTKRIKPITAVAPPDPNKP